MRFSGCLLSQRKRFVYYGLFLISAAFIIWLISPLYLSSIPPSVPEKIVDPVATLSNLVGMQINNLWTPNQKELMESQATIREHLKKENPTIFKKFDYYAADYCGYVVGKRRYIYFSYYFHNPQGGTNLRYTTSPLLVLDGGDSYFQVIFDADQKKVLKLMVNSLA